MFIFVNSITWNAFRKIRATPQRRKYAKELVRSVHRRRKRTYRFCRKKRLFAYIPGSCSVSRFTRKKKTTKEKKKERDKLIYPLFNPNVEVNSSEGRRVSEITWGPRDRKTVGSVCRKTLRSFPLRPLGDFSRSYDRNHVIARAINQLKTTKVTTPSEFRTRYHQPYSSPFTANEQQDFFTPVNLIIFSPFDKTFMLSYHRRQLRITIRQTSASFLRAPLRFNNRDNDRASIAFKI